MKETIDVNFDVKYEGQQNCPKIISMAIFRVFSDHHMWRQNWCQYVWTSLCQFIIFFVNLLHSLHVWLFDIWHLFDNFTSFRYFDTSIKLKPPQTAQGYFMIMRPILLVDD